MVEIEFIEYWLFVPAYWLKQNVERDIFNEN
jgi:hypothetical protein